MKKIFIILFAISLNLNAGWFTPKYLTVSSQPINETGSGVTLINNFSIDFNELTLSNSNIIEEIDVYLKSNIYHRNVYMTISGDNQIKNGEESLDISLTYNGNPITLNEEFKLLSYLEGDRDGGKIGTIKVKIDSVSPIQLQGEYNIDLKMKVKIYWKGQDTQTFPITATVPTVTVAGFTPTQSELGVNKFLGAKVDFGDFEFDKKNSIDKNLYIRSNCEESFYISFDTDEMVHKDDNTYKIAMKYYWDGEAYSKDKEIKALTGRDKGESPVGTLTFETQTIDNSLISGEYRANVGVNITVK